MTDKTSPDQIYISGIRVNGKTYTKLYFDHEDIFSTDATIEFDMSENPAESIQTKVR